MAKHAKHALHQGNTCAIYILGSYSSCCHLLLSVITKACNFSTNKVIVYDISEVDENRIHVTDYIHMWNYSFLIWQMTNLAQPLVGLQKKKTHQFRSLKTIVSI